MFIGHFGVGFAAKRLTPRASLGSLFLAAQFVDLIWPTLLLIGVERVAIVPGITTVTPLDFQHYPISHSLLAVGLWAFFVGGYDIDAEEEHEGAIGLPGLGSVPFEVKLQSNTSFSPSAGVYYRFTEHAECTLELGGGNGRQTTLFNFTWRFGS